MSNVISSKVQFDPYADNGGTIVGIAGNTFVLLAADTRLSHQYAIQSRTISRLFEVNFSASKNHLFIDLLTLLDRQTDDTVSVRLLG